ncbi:MAG: twin-arginine translocase TatA/TatE family subunit [Paramuribaculum sp.]|nr:twin-arginine translocase TatA/TatE family subunit [Paramuribaculum sp.]MDE6460426.1 twin-arginine translocase TatA/TatE family subunit [Paramuribaculum sp.]
MITAFFNLGTGEIIVIVFIILLLFGARRIPELMKGIGKGVKSFKDGMNDVSKEINNPVSESTKEKAEEDKPEMK